MGKMSEEHSRPGVPCNDQAPQDCLAFAAPAFDIHCELNSPSFSVCFQQFELEPVKQLSSKYDLSTPALHRRLRTVQLQLWAKTKLSDKILDRISHLIGNATRPAHRVMFAFNVPCSHPPKLRIRRHATSCHVMPGSPPPLGIRSSRCQARE